MTEGGGSDQEQTVVKSEFECKVMYVGLIPRNIRAECGRDRKLPVRSELVRSATFHKLQQVPAPNKRQCRELVSSYLTGVLPKNMEIFLQEEGWTWTESLQQRATPSRTRAIFSSCESLPHSQLAPSWCFILSRILPLQREAKFVSLQFLPTL